VLLGAHWSLEIVEKRFEVFKQQTHLARFTVELLDFVVAGKVYYVICRGNRFYCNMHIAWENAT
jgi:hypothetical protein